jgi:hypothetical protein
MRKHQISLLIIMLFSMILLASCDNETTRVSRIREADIDGILNHSTEIVDPSGDWISTGHEGDNPGIYPVDYVDINNLRIGLDDQYLYIKLTINGTFPEVVSDFPTFEGDPVNSFGFNMGLDNDSNNRTGCISDGGTDSIIGWGFHSENGRVSIYSQYFTSPTGIETPEQARYQNSVFGVEIQFGGPGHDHFTMAIPLSPLLIAKGQEITINSWAESASNRYMHASFDVLCPESLSFSSASLACPITFRLGEEIIIK